jgi:hypothetical protein
LHFRSCHSLVMFINFIFLLFIHVINIWNNMGWNNGILRDFQFLLWIRDDVQCSKFVLFVSTQYKLLSNFAFFLSSCCEFYKKKTNKLSVARCFSMYTMFLLCFVISHFVLCWKILSSLLVCLIRTHKSSFFLYFYYASTLSMAMGSGVEREKSISNASQCDGCNFFFNAVTRIEFLSSFSSLSYISFRKLNWIVFGKKSSYIST